MLKKSKEIAQLNKVVKEIDLLKNVMDNAVRRENQYEVDNIKVYYGDVYTNS